MKGFFVTLLLLVHYSSISNANNSTSQFSRETNKTQSSSGIKPSHTTTYNTSIQMSSVKPNLRANNSSHPCFSGSKSCDSKTQFSTTFQMNSSKTTATQNTPAIFISATSVPHYNFTPASHFTIKIISSIYDENEATNYTTISSTYFTPSNAENSSPKPTDAKSTIVSDSPPSLVNSFSSHISNESKTVYTSPTQLMASSHAPSTSKSTTLGSSSGTPYTKSPSLKTGVSIPLSTAQETFSYSMRIEVTRTKTMLTSSYSNQQAPSGISSNDSKYTKNIPVSSKTVTMREEMSTRKPITITPTSGKRATTSIAITSTSARIAAITEATKEATTSTAITSTTARTAATTEVAKEATKSTAITSTTARIAATTEVAKEATKSTAIKTMTAKTATTVGLSGTAAKRATAPTAVTTPPAKTTTDTKPTTAAVATTATTKISVMPSVMTPSTTTLPMKISPTVTTQSANKTLAVAMKSSRTSWQPLVTMATVSSYEMMPASSTIATTPSATSNITSWPSTTQRNLESTLSLWNTSLKTTYKPAKRESIASLMTSYTPSSVVPRQCSCSGWKYPSNCREKCCAGGRIMATPVCMYNNMTISHDQCNKTTNSSSCGEVEECACTGSRLSSLSYIPITLMVLVVLGF